MRGYSKPALSWRRAMGAFVIPKTMQSSHEKQHLKKQLKKATNPHRIKDPEVVPEQTLPHSTKALK